MMCEGGETLMAATGEWGQKRLSSTFVEMSKEGNRWP